MTAFSAVRMPEKLQGQGFGGYSDEILYDNMKQAVIKRLPKQEASTLNGQFEDFAGFCGFKPALCRPYRGQTKGKAERTIRFARGNFMAGGQVFFS
jgi:transposase